MQGRNEIRWAPGTRSKFGAPMFEPEVFRKQLHCIEVLVTLLGLFGVRGIAPPLPPWCNAHNAKQNIPLLDIDWQLLIQ